MGVGAFPPKVRACIRERAGGFCERCGIRTVNDYSIQHRKARGMGGTSDVAKARPSNGAWLCGSATTGCHGWVESHPNLAAREGFRVAQDEEPTMVPMLVRSRVWVLLDDDGGYQPFPRWW